MALPATEFCPPAAQLVSDTWVKLSANSPLRLQTVSCWALSRKGKMMNVKSSFFFMGIGCYGQKSLHGACHNYSKLSFFQKIPYLRKQFLVARGGCGCLFLFTFEVVHGFNDKEQHKCNEYKIDHGRNEHAVFDLGLPDLHREVLEIDTPQHHAKKGHKHILHKRVDDLSEGGTDD